MSEKTFLTTVRYLAKFFHECFSSEELARRLAFIYSAITAEGMHYEFSEEGLKCVILRGPSLQWNGYVGVPEGHPLYGQRYSQKREGGSPEELLEVHGGITYSDDSLPGFLPNGLWYFGFDCGHPHDYLPLLLLTDCGPTDYKTRSFVEAETRRLARQLKNWGKRKRT